MNGGVLRMGLPFISSSGKERLMELYRGAQLASIGLISGQVSRGSAGEYQADERAGVARLSWLNLMY